MAEMKLGVARKLARQHADAIEYREGVEVNGRGVGSAIRQLAGYSSNQLVLFGRRYHWAIELVDREVADLQQDEHMRGSDTLAALVRLVEYHDGYREVAQGADEPCHCEKNKFGDYPRAEFDVWTSAMWCTVCDHRLARDDEGRLTPDDVHFYQSRRRMEDRKRDRAPTQTKPKGGFLSRLLGR